MDEHEDHDDGRDDGVDSSSSSGSGSEGVEAGSVELRSVAEALCVEASAPALLAFARALEAAHCWGDMLAVMIIFVGQKPLALEGEGGGGAVCASTTCHLPASPQNASETCLAWL